MLVEITNRYSHTDIYIYIYICNVIYKPIIDMYWGGAFLILSFSCFKKNKSFAFFSSCHLFFLTFFSLLLKFTV